MSEIAKQIRDSSFTNKNLEKMIMTLHTQLRSVSGKKVYGYLPKEIREIVDKIFSEMAKTPQIKAMYEKWCDLERAKYKTYTQKEKDIPTLEQNKVFQPVRNMIIRTVMQMKFPTHEIAVEMPEPDLDISLPIEEVINETVDNSVENYPRSKLYIKWSESYKEAHKLIYNKESTLDDYKKAENLLLSESNNVLALFELGKLYSTEKMGVKDDEKSFEFYEKALQGFIQIESKVKKIKPYLQYQIGMMYFKGLGTSVDNQKAVEYFEKSADKNMWASYQLGRLYFFGADGLERNKEKAMEFLNLSTEQGNEYAQNILDNQEKFENEMLANTIFSLFVNLSRCIEDDYHKNFQSGRRMVDSKLRRMIHEKNQALGIKHEHGQTQEY